MFLTVRIMSSQMEEKNTDTLLFFVPNDKYFLSHRIPMAKAAIGAGFDTGVVTCDGPAGKKISEHGIRVIPCSVTPGASPFNALSSILQLIKIYRREKPKIVHHVTLKAIIIGSIAACFAGVPNVVNAAAGLGYIFNSDDMKAGILRMIVSPAFRILLRRKNTIVLLQNPDDAALMIKRGFARREQTRIIPGSGVDTKEYPPIALPDMKDEIICVFSGRMIGIKGLDVLKKAFEILEAKKSKARLWLCGIPDKNNPGSWSEKDLEEWAQSANVEWKGFCDDMPSIWKKAHIALQPSHGGEGIPKALLEAASCGRPIIASNVPGCREVVDESRNGFLVPPRDARTLADAIEKLASSESACRNFSIESPKVVEEKGFSSSSITQQTKDLYFSLIKNKKI